MSLKHKPAEPAATAAYLFGRHLKENVEWEKYIAGW
jgi:hypothetical protein